MPDDIEKYKDFAKHLKTKQIKELSDLGLRKEIILFFNTTSWKRIYETKRTILALNILKETRDGFELI